MVRLIIKVHDIMDFKEESLYIAVGIADRFLVTFSIKYSKDLSKERPCLMTLAISSIILAGKLSKQKKVCYPKIMALLTRAKGLQHIRRKNLVECEANILSLLDWDLNCTSPISFLERY